LKPRITVVGAGAAGLTAAIFAAQTGAEVVVLERTDKAGKKILMSGGTRCNVLPVEMSLDDYSTSSSPNLMKRIFKSWTVDACKDWFEQELHLPLACERETNKWFPVTNEAKDVRDALLNQAVALGVRIRYDAAVQSLRQKDGLWELVTSDGGIHPSEKVILSSGGYSVPTIGTDGMGHRALQELGIPITPTYPALTPLTGPHPGGGSLAGMTVQVSIHIREANGKVLATNHRSGFLFTHNGFSGPAILDVSHHLIRPMEAGAPTPSIHVNWTGMSVEELEPHFLKGNALVSSVVNRFVPARLAEALIAETYLVGITVADMRSAERKALLKRMTDYPLQVTGHEGYRKAEVTGGGVPLEAIDTATMQVKGHPGLYLCGEILDVFGRIGGFNFYWAWVTGRLAGKG
jgi:predicted Rossmann fold flavoprotein